MKQRRRNKKAPGVPRQSARVELIATPEQKERWSREAAADGVSLSAWVARELDRAASSEEEA